MKKFLKIFLVIILVLGILAGGAVIVLKGMDEDKLAILESKVRPIQEGDKLEGYVFHTDAIQNMTQEDLEDLIEGVDSLVLPSIDFDEYPFYIEWYKLVTFECEFCKFGNSNLFDTGCRFSLCVIKIQGYDYDNDELIDPYVLGLSCSDSYTIRQIGIDFDGIKVDADFLTDGSNFDFKDTGADDYVFNFNDEEKYHDGTVDYLTVKYAKNTDKLMKYVGGVFAHE